ncbi:MAG: 5'-nucleotidase C-terminal domain-containing protein [Candidatus Riflebacteria bacterium]|nr:5'-nucleotidase C-terminal domain-containing protein [Candidatus Riflebacteria bacterium]
MEKQSELKLSQFNPFPIWASLRFVSLVLMLITIVFSFVSNELLAGEDIPSNIAFCGGFQGHIGSFEGEKFSKIDSLLEFEKAHGREISLISPGNMLGPSELSYPDGGMGIARLMNLTGFKVMGLGPHDFFAGLDAVKNCTLCASFPFVFSNAIIENTPIASNSPKWGIQPMAKIVHQGKNCLIISLISPSVIDEWPNWDPRIRVEKCEKTLERMKPFSETASLTILLATMPFEELQEILRKFHWIDFVVANQVTGDDLFRNQSFEHKLLDGRAIFWTFDLDKGIGLVHFHRKNGKKKIESEILELKAEILEDKMVKKEIENLYETSLRSQETQIATLTPDEAKNLPDLLLDALRLELKADVAMIDEVALGDIKKDKLQLTVQSIREIFPYPDRVALLEVTGEELADLWKRRSESLKMGGEGLLFRGILQHNKKLIVNGRPLVRNEKYRLATTEFLERGGLNVLSRNTGKILEKTFQKLLEEFLGKRSFKEDQALIEDFEHRTIYKFNRNLFFSFDKLDFGGSASSYNYKNPNAKYDIPKLMGTPNEQRKIGLEYNAVMDRPTHDILFSMNLGYADLNRKRTVDTASYLLRREVKNQNEGIHPFVQLDYQSTLLPQTTGTTFPRFGRLLIGETLTTGPNATLCLQPVKLFFGAGEILRTSNNQYVSNSGCDLRLEYSQKIFSKLELSAKVNLFKSLDSSGILTSDSEVTFKLPITKNLSTLFRGTKFEWKDNEIGAPASRKDFFFGLNFESSTRKS